MKAAQIVDAIDMIGMGMGEEDGIDMHDLLAQGLLAKVGGGVHQNVPTVVPDKQRSSRSVIPRILRRTGRACAADHRYARGCSAPENGNFHGFSPSVSLTKNSRIHCPLPIHAHGSQPLSLWGMPVATVPLDRCPLLAHSSSGIGHESRSARSVPL